MQMTRLSLKGPVAAKIAVAADFHAKSGEMGVDGILKKLTAEKPDMILCPGDIFNNIHKKSVREEYNINGLRLLEGFGNIAPTFYSIGNHDHGISGENRRMLEAAGVTVLDHEIVRHGVFTIAGLSSAYTSEDTICHSDPVPDLSVTERLREYDGYKILLCHHPEYRVTHLADESIDLTVSGHAHGGQWRFFSRGVYAPGQGLFPRYVAGLYPMKQGTLCVSRGMRNTVKVPRFGNPCEMVLLELVP